MALSHYILKSVSRIAAVIIMLLVLPFSTTARVSGPCSDCHTMHYSQNGGTLSQWGSSGPYNALAINTCAGCHTGLSQNDGSGTPFVYTINEPTYGSTGTEAGTNTLAGGSFYWADADSSTGHDVEGIKMAFDRLPPGFDNAVPGVRTSWPAGQMVTCAGTYGCHGLTTTEEPYEAVRGAHHGDDSVTDGSTLAKSYRMLNGIQGKEDSDREYQPTASAHNQYYATARASGDQSASDSKTISYLCAQCHGRFHCGNSSIGESSPWLRHPTDVKLPATGEYAAYNTDNSYSVVAPVGSNSVSSVLSAVTPGTDNCIITCISCHRAHGSPYYKLMRWDYRNSDMPTALAGCAVCHTEKQ